MAVVPAHSSHDSVDAPAGSLRFAAVVESSRSVAATRSRKAKTAALAGLFAQVDPVEANIVISLIAGDPQQGRIGVGWATIREINVPAAPVSSLTVAQVDAALERVAMTAGPGSVEARRELLGELFALATAEEADFLRRLLLGELRQGANEGLVVEGLAKAAGVKAPLARRALMLSGDLGLVARLALLGGADHLAGVELQVMRPLRPMLASTAADVTDAVDALGEVSVEWKLDGARVQVHRSGDEVRIWTRNLNEVTDRLPDVIEAVRRLPAERLVLDGEVVGYTEGDTPQPFQDTMGAFQRVGPLAPDDNTMAEGVSGLKPFFFDVLHHDGVDLVDSPLHERLGILSQVVDVLKVPGVITDDAAAAQQVLDESLARGHEGVMVKAASSTYEAGRRGKTWRKVKPVHTLDLVVIAIEWGHGRRQGWLSNLHLAALGTDGDFVMVGKTFKGMTDEMLRWQTERFRELETHTDGRVVHVRPEQVVEVAVDGVQTSRRYPGGVALRFARVGAYRFDKGPDQADTIATVQALL